MRLLTLVASEIHINKNNYYVNKPVIIDINSIKKKMYLFISVSNFNNIKYFYGC